MSLGISFLHRCPLFWKESQPQIEKKRQQGKKNKKNGRHSKQLQNKVIKPEIPHFGTIMNIYYIDKKESMYKISLYVMYALCDKILDRSSSSGQADNVV